MSSLILKLENLAVSFGGKQLLNNISLEILKGEQLTILGPSGAGKTVLAHTIVGKYFCKGHISGDFESLDSFQKKVIVVDHTF
jgi:ABC-type transporter Mla maintaining outer membrane lipid asymmetry ATPase subunit MlaF